MREFQKNYLGFGRSLLLVGLVLIVFFVGILFGLVIANWKPSQPSQSDIVFVTGTPSEAPIAIEKLEETMSKGTATATLCPIPSGNWRAYTIQAGDTLSGLAVEAGISQERLSQVNCISSANLTIGQILYLPILPTPTPCNPSRPSNWTLYTVKEGDTIFDLAANRGITSEYISQVNCLVTSDIAAGQQLFIPALPTPTPCFVSPPSNWEIYAIKEDDTLFSLGVQRGITVEEVIQINCLSSTDIAVGQQIYLPSLPTPTPTSLPVSPPTSVPQLLSQDPNLQTTAQQTLSASGSLDQTLQPAPVNLPPSRLNKSTNLQPVRFAAFKPNQIVSPCQKEANEAWIDPVGLNRHSIRLGEPYEVFPGQRIYNFACNFPATSTLTPTLLSAWITHEKGDSQQLSEGLYFDLNRGVSLLPAVNGVVIWNITCDLPQGEYTLTIQYEDPASPDTVLEKKVSFKLKDPFIGEVLVTPEAGPVGTRFSIHYCGYKSDDPLPVTLYRKELSGVNRGWHQIDTWTVYPTGEIGESGLGRARETLWSLDGDPIGQYVVAVGSRENHSGHDFFWLFE